MRAFALLLLAGHAAGSCTDPEKIKGETCTQKECETGAKSCDYCCTGKCCSKPVGTTGATTRLGPTTSDCTSPLVKCNIPSPKGEGVKGHGPGTCTQTPTWCCPPEDCNECTDDEDCPARSDRLPGDIPLPEIDGGGGLLPGGGPDPDGCCGGGSACGYSYCETYDGSLIGDPGDPCRPSTTKSGMCCQVQHGCPGSHIPLPEIKSDCPDKEPKIGDDCGPAGATCSYADPYCSYECDGLAWQQLCQGIAEPEPEPPKPDCSVLPCGTDCTPYCAPDKLCMTAMQYCQPDGTCGMNADPMCRTIEIVPYTGPITAEPEPKPTDQEGEEKKRLEFPVDSPETTGCVDCRLRSRMLRRALFAASPNMKGKTGITKKRCCEAAEKEPEWNMGG